MRTRNIHQILSFSRRGLQTLAVTALATIAIGLWQPASAGCLDYSTLKKQVADWLSPAISPQGRLVKVALVQVNDEQSDSLWERAPIVGLWAFKYISKGNAGTLGIPDGAMVDGGNTIWFADGNEMTSSGVRDPNTGAICMGVWKRTGEFTYELNHIGLAWDPNSSPPAAAGPAFIRQHVVLDKDGSRYTGTFEIIQLKPDGKTAALPAPIKGSIVATRVTLDTTTQVP